MDEPVETLEGEEANAIREGVRAATDGEQLFRAQEVNKMKGKGSSRPRALCPAR
jgi:hypothetical protein